MIAPIRRYLVPGVVLVAIAAAIALAYAPRAVPVTTYLVDRGTVQAVVEEDGITRIRERYTVSPPVTGYVPRLPQKAGDAVRAGDTLFTLEPLPPAVLDARSRAEAEARVARARAAQRAAEDTAEAARTGHELAKKEVDRLRPLFGTGAVSKAQYDQAMAEEHRTGAALASSRAATDIARYELQAAQTALRYAGGRRGGTDERVPVTAPVSGRILAVHREDEGVVAAGEPLLTVGDPGSLEVVVDVLSSDAVRIAPGMRVILEQWGGGAPLEATVRTIEPAAFTKVSALGVEEQRVRVVADLVSPPDDWSRLGDAYRVEARFVIWHSEDTLRIPHSSLFRDDAGWAVFVVRGGRAVRRAVTTGARGLLHVQVLDGLAEGDLVITFPDDRLADGRRVEAGADG